MILAFQLIIIEMRPKYSIFIITLNHKFLVTIVSHHCQQKQILKILKPQISSYFCIKRKSNPSLCNMDRNKLQSNLSLIFTNQLNKVRCLLVCVSDHILFFF
jgi:hypothetical protein